MSIVLAAGYATRPQERPYTASEQDGRAHSGAPESNGEALGGCGPDN